MQSKKSLNEAAAAPIDGRPELLKLVDAVMEYGSKSTILAPIDTSVLPAVRSFLALPRPNGPMILPEFKPNIDNPPEPSWMVLAGEVFQKIVAAITTTGMIPHSLLDPVAHEPLARASVYGDIARVFMEQDQPSGAMSHLTHSLEILSKEIEGQNLSTDYWVGRAYAVSLERMGDLQLRYHRFEDSIRAKRAAQVVYARIGALDGLLYCLNTEAAIWLNLGQLQRAEELFTRLVRETEGYARADEVRYLANLANVYRRLRPYADLEIKYAPKKSGKNEESSTEGVKAPQLATEDKAASDPKALFAAKAGIRISTDVEGHAELSYRDMVESQPIRLLFRGLAVARLNGDASFERFVRGRLAAVYGELGCDALADLVLDQLLEKVPVEKAGPDALLLVFNRLQQRAEEQGESGTAEQAIVTREEMLQVLSLIISHSEKENALVAEELRGERAMLLEAVGRREQARQAYLATIDELERSRGWMRDPENKKGLQAGRWRPYIRGARNALRIYATDVTRSDLLVEAWQLTQAGRSRALLDSISAERDTETDGEGVASSSPR